MHICLSQVLLPVHGPEPDGGRGGEQEGGPPLPHDHHPPDQALDQDSQGHHHAPHQRNDTGQMRITNGMIQCGCHKQRKDRG